MEQKKRKMLPIGIEDFEEIRKKGFYYVDKTGMIRELLANQAKVTLFTRPRRFGKSLNMSMLAHFFSPDGDRQIFDGLEISKEADLCENYMGKYPVISLSLKDVDANDYEIAFRRMVRLIRRAAREAGYLLSDNKLEEQDKTDYRALLNLDMTEDVLGDSLNVLSELLEKYHGKKVILLIDEYDVPLQKAFVNGYYDRMVSLMRSMLGAALKTNDSLEFAVLTGCLRIAKESIFTGLNNLEVFSVTDELFSEYFGFTDREVRELLGYYDIGECYGDVKLWYDGYRFGDTEVYCPWDVLNHCRRLLHNPKTPPQNYWANSSGNDAVREFVRRQGTESARQELETLAEGGTVRKKIRPDLTYRDMYDTMENLWSLLFMTGYLTSRTRPAGGVYELCIPNREIRSIFQDQIMDLFFEESKEDGEMLRILCQAIAEGDAEGVEQSVNGYLRRVISIRDTAVSRDEKENFYHGLLLGLLQFKADWNVTSNYETGDGYGDITVRTADKSLGAVIEVKYAHDGNLDRGVREALEQIEDRRYADGLYMEEYRTIRKYGIACHKKQCKVGLGG